MNLLKSFLMSLCLELRSLFHMGTEVAVVRDQMPAAQFSCEMEKGIRCQWSDVGWRKVKNQTDIKQNVHDYPVRRRPFELQPLVEDLAFNFVPVKDEMEVEQYFGLYDSLETTKNGLIEDSMGTDILLMIGGQNTLLRDQKGFYLFEFNLYTKPKGSFLNWCDQKDGDFHALLNDVDGQLFNTTCSELYRFKMERSFRFFHLNTQNRIRLYNHNRTMLVNYKECTPLEKKFFTITFLNDSFIEKGIHLSTYVPGVRYREFFISPWFNGQDKFCFTLTLNVSSTNEDSDIVVAVERKRFGRFETEGDRKSLFGVIRPDKIGIQQQTISAPLPREFFGSVIRLEIISSMIGGKIWTILNITACNSAPVSDSQTVTVAVPQGTGPVTVPQGTGPVTVPQGREPVTVPQGRESVTVPPTTENAIKSSIKKRYARDIDYNETAVKEDDSAVKNLMFMSIGSNHVTIRWSPPSFANEPVTYTVTYHCLKRMACNLTCPAKPVEMRMKNTSVTLKSLLMYSDYLITVAANNGSASKIVVRTAMAEPTEVVGLGHHRSSEVNNGETVYWIPVPVCSGRFQGYFYTLHRAGKMDNVLKKGITKNPNVTFNDVKRRRDYVVRVYIQTDIATSKKFQEIHFYTSGNLHMTNATQTKSSSSSLKSTSYFFGLCSLSFITVVLSSHWKCCLQSF